MTVTVCDSCGTAVKGTVPYYIPIDDFRKDPDTEAVHLCHACVSRLLGQLAQDHVKAAATLRHIVRTVQSR